MLTCALIVWLYQPLDWNQNDMRKTYLTETECRKNEIINSLQCIKICLLYTSPSPRDATLSRMPSSA